MQQQQQWQPRTNYFERKFKTFDLEEEGGSLKSLIFKLSPDGDESKYPLMEVTSYELMILRLQRSVPYLIIKKDNKFYETSVSIPYDFILTGATFCGMRHRCSAGAKGTCGRLEALPDDMGGCQKVFDYRNARVEKYPWLEFAVETVNTHYPSFLVLKCEHFR